VKRKEAELVVEKKSYCSTASVPMKEGKNLSGLRINELQIWKK